MMLADRVAIVTGAAQGIGAAVAAAFAREGARVVVVDRAAEAATARAGTIREAGGEAFGVDCDVADRAAVDAMVAAVNARYGRIEVWSSALLVPASLALAASAVLLGRNLLAVVRRAKVPTH